MADADNGAKDDDRWTWDAKDVVFESIPNPNAKPIFPPEDIEIVRKQLAEMRAGRIKPTMERGK